MHAGQRMYLPGRLICGTLPPPPSALPRRRKQRKIGDSDGVFYLECLCMDKYAFVCICGGERGNDEFISLFFEEFL